jgi:hypothetical protein
MMPDRQSAPCVLITCTTQWALPARMAMAFAQLGWRVEAVCWYRSPVRAVRCVGRLHHYAATRPLTTLERAVRRAAPTLIVPCDDRALAHLQALYDTVSARGDTACAALIARAIGDPAQAAPACERAGLIDLAVQENVLAPLMLAVDSAADLSAALARTGLPAMLKLDNSWGGDGVAKINTPAEAQFMFAALQRGPGLLDKVRRWLTDADVFRLLPGPRKARTRVNVQRFVEGSPSNCLVSCWQGELLSIIQVRVLSALHAMGPATIVQLSQDPAIEDAARRIVRRLGLSGFCGFDFVIETATGRAQLIEMNQRATPLAHLAWGADRDPAGALAARLAPGQKARPAMTSCDTVAFFPGAWKIDPGNPYLAAAYRDIPLGEPDLVRALTRDNWRQRSAVLRLLRQIRPRRPAPAIWLAP